MELITKGPVFPQSFPKLITSSVKIICPSVCSVLVDCHSLTGGADFQWRDGKNRKDVKILMSPGANTERVCLFPRKLHGAF